MSQVDSKTALRANSPQAFDVEQRGKQSSQKSRWNRGLSRWEGGPGEGALLGLRPFSCPYQGKLSLVPERIISSNTFTEKHEENTSVELSGKLRGPEQRKGEEVSA